jgi:hypothetical protein
MGPASLVWVDGLLQTSPNLFYCPGCPGSWDVVGSERRCLDGAKTVQLGSMKRMPTKRAAQERDDEILAAYEAWDPTTSTLQELAVELGISRSTIYNVLDRNGVEPKGQRPDPEAAVAAQRGDEILDRMAAMALDRLLDDVAVTRQWVVRAMPILRKYIEDPDVAALLADRP